MHHKQISITLKIYARKKCDKNNGMLLPHIKSITEMAAQPTITSWNDNL